MTSKREPTSSLRLRLYLVMCASIPNLSSSMGLLILSTLIANFSMYEAQLSAMTTAPQALQMPDPSS